MRPKRYAGQMGTLTLLDNAPDSNKKFALTGFASGNFAEVDPTSLDFGYVDAGDQPSESIALSNVESGLLVKSITVSGPFKLASQCPTKKGWVFGTCQIGVQVDTSQLGTARGELGVNTDAVDGSLEVPISADVVNRAGTQTELRVAPNPATTADDVIATASVSPIGTAPAFPSGEVSST